MNRKTLGFREYADRVDETTKREESDCLSEKINNQVVNGKIAKLFNTKGEVCYLEPLFKAFDINHFINNAMKVGIPKASMDLKNTITRINSLGIINIKSALLIEDEPEILMEEYRMIKILGHYTEMAESVTTGEKLFNRNPMLFDYAIIDQKLKGGLGEELARKFMEVNKNIRVVIISGNIHTINVKNLKGILCFEKPFNVKDIFVKAA